MKKILYEISEPAPIHAFIALFVESGNKYIIFLTQHFEERLSNDLRSKVLDLIKIFAVSGFSLLATDPVLTEIHII